MKIHYGLLQAIHHVYKTVTQNTPNRLDHIFSYIQGIWPHYQEIIEPKCMVLIYVGDDYADEAFDFKMETLLILANKLSITNHKQIDVPTGPVVLLPTKLICC